MEERDADRFAEDYLQRRGFERSTLRFSGPIIGEPIACKCGDLFIPGGKICPTCTVAVDRARAEWDAREQNRLKELNRLCVPSAQVPEKSAVFKELIRRKEAERKARERRSSKNIIRQSLAGFVSRFRGTRVPETQEQLLQRQADYLGYIDRHPDNGKAGYWEVAECAYVPATTAGEAVIEAMKHIKATHPSVRYFGPNPPERHRQV